MAGGVRLMATTSIERTRGEDGTAGMTWNPTTGCDQVSHGCDNCYAMTMAKRLKAMGSAKYQRDGDPRTSGPGFGVTEHPDVLSEPFKWRKPRKVFVNSMSDLFHPSVSDGFIAQVRNVMAQNPQHTFQILTKRHARMRSWVNRWADRTGDRDADDPTGFPPLPQGPEAVRATYKSGRGQLFADMLDSIGTPPEGCAYPLYDWMEGQRFWSGRYLSNVWLGVSVEDQHWADIRIPALLDTPAAVRFLSVEPMLGPVKLREEWLADDLADCSGRPAIAWVITGGESGRDARPIDQNWVRAIRDQCVGAGVAFLHKQWGGIRPKTGGRELDGRTWDEYPNGAR